MQFAKWLIQGKANTTSLNNTTTEPTMNIFNDLVSNILLNIACIIFILASFTGNSLVIVLFIRFKDLQTPFSLFILNMAVADTMTAFYGTITYGSVVVNSLIDTSTVPPLVKVMFCQIDISFGTLFGKLSITTIAVISFERYLAIKYPLQYKGVLTKRRTILIIFFIWVFAIIFSIHIFLFTAEASIGNNIADSTCFDVALSQGMPSKVTLIMELICGYLLQMVVIVITSYKIVKILWFPKAQQNGANLNLLRRRRRVTKIIISVVVAFNVFWLPWATWVALLLFGYKSFLGTFVYLLPWQIAHSAVNPILYSISSESFRRKMMIVLTCKKRL